MVPPSRRGHAWPRLSPSLPAPRPAERVRVWLRAVPLAVSVFTLTACVELVLGEDDDPLADRVDAVDPVAPVDAVDPVDAERVEDHDGAGDAERVEDHDGAVTPLGILEIADDMNEYWIDVAPELGFEFEPVPDRRISFGREGPTCNGSPVTDDEVAGNAFVDAGCSEGLLVAIDPDYAGASLARAEGTMAHEWGHVVQFQATELDLSLDPDGLPIDAELQADCFAGAWAAERATAPLAEIRADVATTGDPDDVDLDDPDAHGTAEERVAAFDFGAERGPVACVDDLVAELP